MKSTGVVRKVDELGRVVLPKELRDVLDIPERTPLEIFTEGSTILLKKYEPGCVFCGNVRDVTSFKGKCICKECMKDLK